MANTTDVEVVRYVADVSQLEASQRGLESSLRTTAKEAEKTSKSVKGLGDQEKKLSSETSTLNKNLNQTDDSLKKTTKASDDAGKSVSNFGKITGAAAVAVTALFSVQAVIAFAKQVFNVTSEFQKLEAVLTNTLGSSSLAQKALSDIRKFAAETPFSVQELTSSYVKLANQGFKPTVNQLRQLGDLASSTGKGFDQLTEAIIDAQTGEFERLKEFGIRASKEGDKVSFTFKGVKTQADFTNESIRNYILSLGDLEGVSGASAAISETLGGALANLGDKFESFFLTIGQGKIGGLYTTLINGASETIDVLTDLVKTFDQRQSEAFQKRIDEQIKARNQADNNEINALVEQGVKLEEAQKQIYNNRAALAADVLQQDKERLKQQEAVLAVQNRLALQGGAGTQSLLQRKKQNEQEIVQLKYNIKLREFLVADYYAKVDDIEKKALADQAAKDALKEKNAKALADAEAKAFALQEQQRRAYNDFSISLIENQFDREAATLKEQFFRKIEDSKKNIGFEITTNSEEYKRLNDELIRQLQTNEVKRKEFEDAAAAARSKAIIDRVNKEIAAQESAGNTTQAAELKSVRDGYEQQLAAGVEYAKAKEKLDQDVAAVTFKTRNDTLNQKIEHLESESVRYADGSAEKIEINKKLGEKILEQDKLAFDERERLRQLDLKKDKEAAQLKQQIYTASVNVITAALNAAIDLRQQALTNEIETERAKLQQQTESQKAAIDRRSQNSKIAFDENILRIKEIDQQVKNGVITEEEASAQKKQIKDEEVNSGYINDKRAAALKAEVDKQAAKKEQDLKLRQFKADQQAAVSRALLGIASGVINAFATLPYPAALVAAAGIAAVGAIEIATIKNQKPPKYKDGVIDMPGKGTGTSDSNPAMLSKGESVMTAKETKQYKPELEAIRKGTFEKMMQQKYSTEQMSFLPFDRAQANKRAEYKARSEANKARSERDKQLDLSNIENLTRKNSRIHIRNAEEIGKAVARNLPSNTRYTP